MNNRIKTEFRLLTSKIHYQFWKANNFINNDTKWRYLQSPSDVRFSCRRCPLQFRRFLLLADKWYDKEWPVDDRRGQRTRSANRQHTRSTYVSMVAAGREGIDGIGYHAVTPRS